MDMYNRHYAPANAAMWSYPNIRQHPSYMTPQQAIAVYHQHPQMREWAARTAMMGQTKTAETKPRLAKEEVEQLEAEFQKNPKPNSSLKKGLAEQMRVDVARINNWFQNRRAKAKQEKRSAEFEAKQKLDEERADPRVSEFFGDSNHIDDLRPSSAPLPTQQSPLSTSTALSPPSPATPESQDLLLASPSIKPEPANGSAHSPNDFASPESIFVAPETEQPDLNYIFHSQTPDTTDLHHHHHHLHHPHHHLPAMVKPGLELRTGSVGESPFGGYVIPSFHLYNDVALAGQDPTMYSHSSPESTAQSPEIPFRSQPSNIASRRNAPRPAPLGLNSLRAHVQPGPKTADGSRLHDRPRDSMRRVSSASTSTRIHKSVSASPLNRYVERKPEMLLHLARSPNLMTKEVVAPPPTPTPTPDTPRICAHQAFREGTAAAGTPSSDENAYNCHGSPFHSIQLTPDHNLKTPPTTPAMVVSNITDALFGDAQYSSSSSCYDDTAFGSANLMPSADSIHSLQHYFASSQPPTPSYHPSQPGYSMTGDSGSIMTHYQLYPYDNSSSSSNNNNNNDYTWPEPATIASAQSSPGLSSPGSFQTQFTFNNSTLDDYCEPKC